MRDYVRISLETHLFFARIMKEHSLFLQAGFVAKDAEWIQRAEFFRVQFEDLLRRTVQISNRMISENVLKSEELVTCFTVDAERRTSALSGIPIDSRIAMAEKNLECGCDFEVTREMVQMVHRLNERAVWLLNGLIDFKERILRAVKECRMFTTNYPLLVDHILREAKLYRETVEGLMQNQRVCFRNLQNQEEFWNCIMMEHALFIRGLLDPCEAELIDTADEFAKDFQRLLERARRQDCRASEMQCRDCCDNETREADRRERNDERRERNEERRERNDERCGCNDERRERNEDRRERNNECCDCKNHMDERRMNNARMDERRMNEMRMNERRMNEAREAERRMNENRMAEHCERNTRERSLQEITLEKTIELRDFKAAGTQGLLNCQIQSIILPLLADHVLREANHYIRILEHGYQWQEG